MSVDQSFALWLFMGWLLALFTLSDDSRGGW